MKGRKPKPTAIKLLDGTADVNPGRINRAEPPTIPGEPEPPDSLDALALNKWHDIVALHRERGTLSREIAGTIATYCEVFTAKERYKAILKEEGSFLQGTHGTPIAHPALRALERAQMMLTRLDVEFGFTPSSRTRCVVNAPPKDDLEDFLTEAKA